MLSCVCECLCGCVVGEHIMAPVIRMNEWTTTNTDRGRGMPWPWCRRLVPKPCSCLLTTFRFTFHRPATVLRRRSGPGKVPSHTTCPTCPNCYRPHWFTPNNPYLSLTTPTLGRFCIAPPPNRTRTIRGVSFGTNGGAWTPLAKHAWRLLLARTMNQPLTASSPCHKMPFGAR